MNENVLLKQTVDGMELIMLGGNSIIVPVIVDLGQKLKNLCEKYNVIGNEDDEEIGGMQL